MKRHRFRMAGLVWRFRPVPRPCYRDWHDCGPRRWYDGCDLCGLQFEATIHRPGRTR